MFCHGVLSHQLKTDTFCSVLTVAQSSFCTINISQIEYHHLKYVGPDMAWISDVFRCLEYLHNKMKSLWEVSSKCKQNIHSLMSYTPYSHNVKIIIYHSLCFDWNCHT